MNVTSSGLIKAAGAAAAVAGSIFIAVQVNHPAEAPSPPRPPSGWCAAPPRR